MGVTPEVNPGAPVLLLVDPKGPPVRRDLTRSTKDGRFHLDPGHWRLVSLSSSDLTRRSHPLPPESRGRPITLYLVRGSRRFLGSFRPEGPPTCPGSRSLPAEEGTPTDVWGRTAPSVTTRRGRGVGRARPSRRPQGGEDGVTFCQKQGILRPRDVRTLSLNLRPKCSPLTPPWESSVHQLPTRSYRLEPRPSLGPDRDHRHTPHAGPPTESESRAE